MLLHQLEALQASGGACLARLLEHTLPALAAQELAPGLRYEVILVSNGSVDDTVSIARPVSAR